MTGHTILHLLLTIGIAGVFAYGAWMIVIGLKEID